jgi:hypothetical protein
MSSPSKKIVNFKAVLVSDTAIHSAIIENLSKDSLYIRAVPVEMVSDLIPGKTLEVKFQPTSDETMCLSCKVKWSYKTPPHGITNSLGIEILDPLPRYEDFFETLK